MLLRFSFANSGAFWQKQEISFVASRLDDRTDGLLKAPRSVGVKVLPSIVLYGPNASGKTSVLKALSFVCTSRLSHPRGVPGKGVPRTPFLLAEKGTEQPSEYELDFIADKVRYVYGFRCDNRRFSAEWLYSFPKGRPVKLFERSLQKFQFGRELKGRNKAIVGFNREDCTFLSTAAQNAHEGLASVYNFLAAIRVETDIIIDSGAQARSLDKRAPDQRTLDFLGKLGTGVTSFRKFKEKLSDDSKKLRKAILDVIAEAAKEKLPYDPEEDDTAIELGHLDLNGRETFLPLKLESSGTRRLLNVMRIVYTALDEGSVVAIDELEASLHTQACEAILALFAIKETNPKGAQLLTTTHNTNLLTSEYLRRDQVWLVEKDKKSLSSVYPLTNIKTRKSDNLEKGYLEGRFGAVPFTKSILTFVTEK
jgi:predicted ATPase